MQFYFIRHAQSTNNLLYDSGGDSAGRSEDPPLTEIGYEQAHILARFLRTGNPGWKVLAGAPPGFGITHLYTSLMIRAVATGTAVASELKLPLVVWEDLHETGGIYFDDEAANARVGQPGKNRAFFQKHFPGLVLPDSVGEAGWWNRSFEETDQRPARAQRFLAELRRRHGDASDCVAVISHGGFYNVLLQTIFGIAREDFWFSLNNTAITRMDTSPDTFDLVYMNRLDFMPKELAT